MTDLSIRLTLVFLPVEREDSQLLQNTEASGQESSMLTEEQGRP